MGHLESKDTNSAPKSHAPNVAVTFNEEVGGASSKAILKTVASLGAKPIPVDYRGILSKTADGYESIHHDPDQRKALFLSAKKTAHALLQDKDALILTGSDSIIDPRLYGKTLEATYTPHELTDLARSIAELALLHVAVQKGMPILGICAGHQLINVYFGGTLKWLDIPDLLSQQYANYETIEFIRDSEIGQLLLSPNTKNTIIEESVFGAHVQVVKQIGGKNLIQNDKDFLTVVARSKDHSNNIEAVEANHGSPLYGLQFHPEVAASGLVKLGGEVFQADKFDQMNSNANLIVALIDAANTYHIKQTIRAEELASKKAELKNVHDHQPSKPDQSTQKKKIPTEKSPKNPIQLQQYTPFLKQLRRSFTSTRFVMAEIAKHIGHQMKMKPSHENQAVKEAPKQNRPTLLRDIFSDVAPTPKAAPSYERPDQVRFIQIQLDELNTCLSDYESYLKDATKRDNWRTNTRTLAKKLEVLNTLKSCAPKDANSKTLQQDLQQFQRAFKEQYRTLAHSADSKSVYFLKAILSVLLALSIVGSLALPTLWKNHYYDQCKSVEKRVNQIRKNLAI